MRMLSLAVFAAVALVVGAYEEDEMTLLIGVASALAAAASLTRFRTSVFLSILSDLFAAETILFGLADLVSLTGHWPKAYEDYELPRYLPLATALFGVVIFAVSYFPFVQRMLRITDPFFARRTPISIHPWPLPRLAVRQSLYARINVFFLILINQFQVAIGVRLNFFYRAFGNAIQVPDEAHMGAFWHELLWVFSPLVTISILAFLLEFYVSLNFVLQWRRWMTASYTSRWLLHSMHYQLAVRGGQTDNPDQQRSRRTSAASSAARAAAEPTRTWASTTIPSRRWRPRPTWWPSRSSCGGSPQPWTPRSSALRFHGFLFWVAVLYACFATGMMHLIGRSLSRLMFRQQAVEANFRFDLARIREFSEQIALLKGEDREIDRAGRVFNDVFTTVQRIIRVRTFLNSFLQFYTQISVDHSLYLRRALLFRGEEGRLRDLQPGGRRLLERQLGDELLRQSIHGSCRLQRHDPAPHILRGGLRARPRRRGKEAQDRDRRRGRSDPVDPRPRSFAARRAQTRPCRRPRADPAGAHAGRGPYGRRQVHALSRHRGILAIRQGEILQPPYAKLMLLPQRPYIPIGPLREALAYPAASSTFSDDELRETLKKVGLGEFADRLDESENWQMRLSGGEQQRLAVARALLAKPDWLFLDESTASLDEKSEADLYHAIAETLPETTLVSIGHRSTLNAFHKRRIAFQAHTGDAATIAAAPAPAT